MAQPRPWLDEIKDALIELGGHGHYKDIYKRIEERGVMDLAANKDWTAQVRGTIERYSSDSDVYNGKKDIFYSAEGKGRGHWGLRNFNKIENNVNLLQSYYGFSKEQISATVNNEYNNVQKEIGTLIKKSLSKPNLKDGLSIQEVKINKIPRDAAFAISIKEIYENKCAICGMNILTPKGYPEVQAAHIYPKSKDGSDDLRNGICLCHFHHWALDAGWISISDKYEVLVKESIPKTEQYWCIYKYKGKKLNLPQDKRFIPNKLYLKENRKLNGFE